MPPKTGAAKKTGTGTGTKKKVVKKTKKDAPASSASADPPVEAEPTPELPPPPPPVEGTCKVKYNHYNQEFKVIDGNLKWEDIDEEYCISFAFQGNFGKKLLSADGDEMEQLAGIFKGLAIDEQYTLAVQEDPELEDAPKRVYVASGNDKMASMRKNMDDSGMGEDSANCSCIEGNPCASPYNCKNWANRFEVAKANGWKGHG
ncbi:hypothetical protein CYMTET_3706 [Cymbomonas tetramitiformis]|uniref:Uncharacterized protein n=1 Tax=Cymbomonas tetramitiformis TaxID=36881 RepID=A0AAE0LKJ8_9CHLO|nr:hypothetical protein CYMTET_3706 [Cymbomonas tetramitiformis]|eukprot:gene1865-2534_t